MLDAAYQVTLLAGVPNARRGASNLVALTLLGAGAFGNATARVHSAIERAARRAVGFDLAVRLVSYGTPSAEMRELVNRLRNADSAASLSRHR